MNTTENNKLIAEFMGRSISPITLAEFRKLKPRDKHLVNGAFVEDLQYHSDWNWLMEVVEKIKTMGYFVSMDYLGNSGYIPTNYSSTERIAQVSHKPNPNVSNPPTSANPVFINEFDEPKEALYNLIVRFIKWYNEQNK
jgi:hypothetical protein